MHKILVNNNQLIEDAKGISRYYNSIAFYLRKRVDLELLFDKTLSNPVRRKLREQTVSLRNRKYDLLWSPSQMGPIRAANHVVTVHDLIPLHPESGISSSYKTYFKNSVGLLVRRAKHIVCISASVADMVQLYYGVRSARISVIRNGYDFVDIHSNSNTSKNLSPILTGKNYLLFVGTLSNHKNLLRLIDAFRLFKKDNNSQLELVIAGHFPNTISLGNIKLDFAILKADGILFMNDPSDEELHRLYANCRGLIMPSLIEGFGLPVSEALSFGKPVICSDISVFRELFSGMVRSFFNPYDIESMSNAIKLLNHSELGLEPDEAKAYSKTNQWTWERVSTQYENLFNNLCG